MKNIVKVPQQSENYCENKVVGSSLSEMDTTQVKWTKRKYKKGL